MTSRCHATQPRGRNLLDHTTIISKTAKGIAEIESASRTLPTKLRTALILIDGQTTVGDILGRMGEMAPHVEERIKELIERGYLTGPTEPVSSMRTDTVRPPLPGDPQSALVAGHSIQHKPGSVPDSPRDAVVGKLTPAQRDGLQDLLKEALGLHADKFSGRFRSCRSGEEVLILLEEIWTPLQNFSGKAKAVTFVKNARALLGAKS